ncbi:MAG: acyloxyacyl hydrolase [Phycisphaerales bacterium JB054]
MIMCQSRPPRHRRPLAGVLVVASLCLVPGVAAAGDGDAARLSTEGARLSMTTRQPDAEAASQPDSSDAQETTLPRAAGPAKPYGTAGTEWILFGTGAAYDFDDNTDLNLTLGYSRFLADDIEWMLELAGWYHAQEGEDALSLNPAMEFRWHFFNRAKTSAFLNVGIGVLGATDNVPFDGTGFNFTPRAGIGMTHQISDDGTRLVGGLRWHHISNARIHGDDSNPSRDAPLVYLQVAIPF